MARRRLAGAQQSGTASLRGLLTPCRSAAAGACVAGHDGCVADNDRRPPARRGHGAKFGSVTDHQKGLQKAINENARQAERHYKAQHPEAVGLKVMKTVVAYVPRAQEVRDVPIRAVGLFLSDPSSLAISNAKLAARLGKDIGRKVPENILTEQLTERQRGEVRELLALRNVHLDLAACDTASKIKKALKGKSYAEGASVRATVAVSFSEDAVTVGNRSYPINRRDGVPRIALDPRTKLNVDALKRLLCEPT